MTSTRLFAPIRIAASSHAPLAGVALAGGGRYIWGVSNPQATIAEEEYLQVIFWLIEAEMPITAANIARAMQLSPPTVHEMIKRLEADGYVTRDADKTLALTPEGLEEAETITRRHRMIERFLTDVLGIPWDEVHEEAERLEHAMSPAIEAICPTFMTAPLSSPRVCAMSSPLRWSEACRSRSALSSDWNTFLMRDFA